MCIFMALLIGLTRWCDNRSGKRRDDHMITDALRWSEKGGSGASTGSGAGSAPRPGQSRSTSKTGRYADPTRLLSDDGHGPPGWDQREYALDPINRRNQPAYTNGNVNGNGGNMPYRREPLPRVNVSTTSPPARQRALHQQQPYLAPRGLAQQPPGYPAFSSVAPGASQLRHPQQTY
jgi:hypothetical protein